MKIKVLEILVLLVILLCVWRGAKRGFLQTVFVSCAFVFSMALSLYATPYVSAYLIEHTSIDEKVTQWTIENLDLNLQEELLGQNEQISQIDSLPYPELIRNSLLEHNNAKDYVEMQVESFESYMATCLTSFVMRLLSFLVIQFLTTLAFLIAVYTSKGIKELPVVGEFDAALGALLGLIQALAIVWTIMLLLLFFSGTTWGTYLMNEVENSRILSFLYAYNLILRVIMKFF